jgi:hypothetical protein
LREKLIAPRRLQLSLDNAQLPALTLTFRWSQKGTGPALSDAKSETFGQLASARARETSARCLPTVLKDRPYKLRRG